MQQMKSLTKMIDEGRSIAMTRPPRGWSRDALVEYPAERGEPKSRSQKLNIWCRRPQANLKANPNTRYIRPTHGPRIVQSPKTFTIRSTWTALAIKVPRIGLVRRCIFTMSTSAESVAATPIAASADARPVPEGFRPHSEGQASILVPLGNTAFLNPIQEYNRDLSVCVIEHWARVRSKEMQDKFETGWRKRQEKGGKGGKKRKREQQQQQSTTESASTVAEQPEAPLAPPAFTEPRFTILEALSATGLRSIRYAKEIKQAGIVLANDFSPSACDAMRQNVEFNGVGAVEVEAGSKLESAADASETTVEGGAESSQPTAADASRRSFQARGLRGRRFAKSGVIVNQGDAA